MQEWVESPFKDGTRPLAGLTLGLLGCGDIGQQIVKAAKAMGLKTAAFKRDTSSPGAFRSVVRRVRVTAARRPVVVAACA
jgi:phosphoglycerate dehydrogenase-like enzyme